jgi:hypothetical protein
MSNADALLAITLLTVFLGGIAAGVIVIVAVASHREDTRYSLDGEAPDSACRGARHLTGTWVRGAGFRPASWTDPDDPAARSPGARR